jgi:hypothetical protein
VPFGTLFVMQGSCVHQCSWLHRAALLHPHIPKMARTRRFLTEQFELTTSPKPKPRAHGGFIHVSLGSNCGVTNEKGISCSFTLEQQGMLHQLWLHRKQTGQSTRRHEKPIRHPTTLHSQLQAGPEIFGFLHYVVFIHMHAKDAGQQQDWQQER